MSHVLKQKKKKCAINVLLGFTKGYKPNLHLLNFLYAFSLTLATSIGSTGTPVRNDHVLLSSIESAVNLHPQNKSVGLLMQQWTVLTLKQTINHN